MGDETKQVLELILNKLEGVEERLEGMEERLEGMEERLEGMEERLEGVEERLEGMEERFGGMEKRQDEIFEVVKAIEHSNQTHKAEIDSLTYKVSHVEGTVNGVGEFIQGRKVI